MLLDLDVKGALSIKSLYPKETIMIFIIPPNISDLKTYIKNEIKRNKGYAKKKFPYFSDEQLNNILK